MSSRKADAGKSGAQASAPRKPAGGAPTSRVAAGAAHRVRIIGGAWKRTPLTVVDVPGLRPTPDRVRETLFNWLGGDLSGATCLDLFAGTGALGLEAASRGASRVWLVEPDRRARAAIAQTLERLGAGQVRLLAEPAAGAIALARREGARFDLVFLDPPFGQDWLRRTLPGLPEVLDARARIYVESESELDDDAVAALLGPGFHVGRSGRAGQVFYHLILRSSEQEA